jgi:uncharacterized membrane protein
MTSVPSIFVWLESTRLAKTVGDSLYLTGFLSSVHLLGMTLVAGGALLSGLRLLGRVFTDQPIRAVTTVTSRAIVIGLGISVTTGILLLAPRATKVSQNGYFQIKMILLVAAVACHVSLFRMVTVRPQTTRAVTRLTGALGVTLWFGVVLAACAFILLGE